MTDITITNSNLNEILSVLGLGVITIDDLEFSKKEIRTFFILPAVREYYTWFPKREESSQNISSSFTIAFPSADIFGVLDVRLNTAGYSEGRTSSPFVNYINYTQARSKSYGTKYSYNLEQASIYERMERQAAIEANKAFRVKVDIPNSQITGYTNVTGLLNITWAKWDETFSNIPFRRIGEVIRLCQAHVLRGFAMVRGQQQEDLPVNFNYDLFMSRADDLEEDIMNKWKAHTKPIIMRG